MGKGRAPCCDKSKVKKGPWSPAEDLRLISFIHKNGHDNWRALPKQAGLLRCGKSCRLRWINYLRPDVKRGNFTREEEETIIRLHQALGNKWSKIATFLPGRTDNEIKNVWNTHLKKRLSPRSIAPNGHELKEFSTSSSSTSSSSTMMSSNEQRNLGVELNPQWNQLSMMNKKPRIGEVCNEASRPSNEAKEFSSSCISSNSQVDISRKAEIQMGSVLDIMVPYGTVLTTLEEVNKPEIQDMASSEIPLESDYDFWDMLDNLRAFQSNETEMRNVGASTLYYGDGEFENKKWLFYLENELGLEANQPKDVVEPLFPQTFQREKLLMNQEVNPGNGNYHHLWPCL